jgi:hypothetical protein
MELDNSEADIPLHQTLGTIVWVAFGIQMWIWAFANMLFAVHNKMNNYSIESYINSVVQALGIGASIEDIHDSLIKKGCQEDDAFLVFKAGEILYNSLKAQEEVLAAEAKILAEQEGNNNVN